VAGIDVIIHLYSKPPAMLVWLNKAMPSNERNRLLVQMKKFELLNFWLPTVLSFERRPRPPWRESKTGILSKERSMFRFYLPELLRTGKETKKQNPSSGSDI